MKGSGKRRSEDGFNLVVLAVLFMVMNILLAKALPLWSTQIQRDKESELIFRGLQYAEAIRVFQTRFNRAPVRLQELIEVEPRCIRQLWNNPLSPESAGKPPAAIGWEPIFEGQPDQPNQPGAVGPAGRGRASRSEDDDDEEADGGEPGRRRFGEGEEVKIGPILGVRSQVGDSAIKMFFDSDAVAEWKFTTGCFQVRMRAGGDQQPMPVNASEIGRPWPPDIQPLTAVQSCEPVRQRQTRGRDLGGASQRGGRPGQPQPGAPARGQTLNPPSGKDGRQR